MPLDHLVFGFIAFLALALLIDSIRNDPDLYP